MTRSKAREKDLSVKFCSNSEKDDEFQPPEEDDMEDIKDKDNIGAYYLRLGQDE